MKTAKFKLTQKLMLLCISLLFFNSCGQKTIDSANLISYDQQVMLRLNFDTNLEDFIVRNQYEQKNIYTRLSVNNSLRSSISIDYQLISMSLSLAPDFLPGNNDNELKGKSSYSELRFRFFPENFIQSLYYRNVKGFYVTNMEDFLPNWRKGIDPFLQFPDLRIRTYGGSTSYVFNKNFSLKSIYYQREWQKITSGSIIPTFEYDITFFTNTIDGRKNSERQLNLGFNMGYYYNWVIAEKISFAPHFLAGIGGKWSSYSKDSINETKSDKETDHYVTAKLESGIHIGYNSSKFLFGGKLNYITEYYRQNSTSDVFNNNFYGLLYIGYRFPPPKTVKSNYDKIKKKIPAL